jgi:hypothetical protein
MARRLVFAVLIGTLIAILLVDVQGYETFVKELQPRILNGAFWLFSCLAGLILWYRLPLKPFYKGVVLSYVPYLLLTTAASTAVGERQFKNSDNIQYFNQLAYDLLLVYWNVIIWRRDRAVRAPRDSEPPPGTA